MFSKMVTDLANKLLLCPEWDTRSLRNPNQVEMPNPAPKLVVQVAVKDESKHCRNTISTISTQVLDYF
jgi:hypothetical protein